MAFRINPAFEDKFRATEALAEKMKFVYNTLFSGQYLEPMPTLFWGTFVYPQN